MRDYLRLTRLPLYSYVFVIPLLLLYQASALLANLGQRRAVINGADALLHNALSVVGVRGWVGSWLVLAVVVGAVIYRMDAESRKKPFRWSLLPLLLAECSAYALVLGTLVASLTRLVLPGGGLLQAGPAALTFGQSLAAGLGAGLYEELVFRLLIAGGLLWAFRKAGMKEIPAVLGAVLLSSLVFSLYHYVGPYGEALALGSFAFRFVGGVVLAALFAWRGFAVAAWTHSLYDVFLIVARGGL